MRRLKNYEEHFNPPPADHRRYGHLFQNQYKSIVCQEDRYLKELVRYIHLNLSRAGLVRSLGGWSEVLTLRGRGEKQRSDQRILGDSEFVQDVISGLDDLVKKNLRLSGQRINIAA